jgi:hypothetical protein
MSREDSIQDNVATRVIDLPESHIRPLIAHLLIQGEDGISLIKKLVDNLPPEEQAQIIYNLKNPNNIVQAK